MYVGFPRIIRTYVRTKMYVIQVSGNGRGYLSRSISRETIIIIVKYEYAVRLGFAYKVCCHAGPDGRRRRVEPTNRSARLLGVLCVHSPRERTRRRRARKKVYNTVSKRVWGRVPKYGGGRLISDAKISS